ncbi:MAG TPA: tetratricopeptide repeat protein, partial [Vicinamibacterales bacterium]|nr:tetratricopeptide repeat protein [Vicinamibacterales bacterium]
EMLESYKTGKFTAVVAELEGDIDFKDLLKQLQDQGPAWIEAGGPDDRDRRELVAATFALEAARADEWREWKFVWKQPPICGPDETHAGCIQPLSVLEWKAPPLLIEWACRRFRKDEKPRPIERWWQLAALAVAQRSEDGQFLVGDTSIGLGVDAGEILNPKLEIKHLEHVRKRFPEEARFMLAEGIARDRFWQDDATQAYGALANDPVVGGEAMMRMGVMLVQMGRREDALTHFDRAEFLTRDRYVIYLVKYFRGRIAESQRRNVEALDAYRGAVAAWPRAQSATLALASLLFQSGRRAEAQELAAAMLEANPRPADPWREYVHADNRFWPLLVGKLRAEILK